MEAGLLNYKVLGCSSGYVIFLPILLLLECSKPSARNTPFSLRRRAPPFAYLEGSVIFTFTVLISAVPSLVYSFSATSGQLGTTKYKQTLIRRTVASKLVGNLRP